MRRSVSILGLAALLAFSAAGQAAAVTEVATYSGTITSGVDVTGVFGAPGSDLTGQKYTTAYTFDPSLGKAYPASFDERDGGWIYGATSPILDVAITIEGKTYHYTPVTVGVIATAAPGARNPAVSAYGWSNYGDSQYFPIGCTRGLTCQYSLQIDYHLESSNNSGSSALFNSPNSLLIGVPPTPVTPGADSFSVYVEGTTHTPIDYAYGSYGGATTYSLTGAAPEPANWLLMTLGVGGMGAALRMRRKAVAA